MKKLSKNQCKTFFVFCFLGFCCLINAQSLLLQEDFDFVAGTDVAGQNGWAEGASGTNNVLVSNAGLSYTDYPDLAVGNAATFLPTSDRLQKTFTGTLSGTYYYSFLMNVTSAGSGDFFIGYYSNGAFRGRAYIKSDGVGFQFGLTKTTTGTVNYTSGIPYNFGITYLVVVEYDFLSGSGIDDRVSLYINPDLNSSAPGTPVIGPLSDAGNDAAANVLAIQGRANSGCFTLDGIRLATDWHALKGEVSENHFIEIPKFISSHMVLQRETPLKFWGWGSVGDTIRAVFTRQGTSFTDSAIIDQNGRWRLLLPAQNTCNESCLLSFGIKNKPGTFQTFDDILVGDVWFAGGQSNMEKKVSHLLEASQCISEADNYPMIRSFRASYFAKSQPQERVNGSSGSWFTCNSLEVGDKVSAVAYVYACKLFNELNIPIGIVQSYRGGTEIETWMSPSKIASDLQLCKVAGRIASIDSTNATAYPSIHFNGQINPLKGFPIKGFIFYQGESNIKRALEYRSMMETLIEDWRSLWGMGDLPFYYVQMFNMGVSENQLYEEGNWQDLREQQEQLLADGNIPHIGMAVTIDTNEDPDNADDLIRIHPKNKKPVGERLALIALKQTYGMDIIAESPMLSRYWFSNDTAYLVFKNQGAGLKIKEGDTELKGFVVAAADKAFKWANARILNDSTIAVKSSLVSAPVSVRYGWARNPVCNLYNSVGLPASPFRTDIWPSGYLYQTFKSTCAASSDASLIFIRVNGVRLPAFQPENTVCSFESNDLPQLTAIANSPFASVSIEQPTLQNGRKAVITVTAEDKSVKKYEVLISNPTGIRQMKSDGIHAFQQNRKLILDIESDVQGIVSIFDSTGQRLLNSHFEGNHRNEYTIPQSGIYFARLSKPEGEYTFKFLME